MNETNYLSDETLPPEIYRRGMWAVTIFGAGVIFYFAAWIGIQRAEIVAISKEKREAEQRNIEVARERDDALRERVNTTRRLNDQVAKTEAARLEIENKLRDLMERTITTEPSATAETRVPSSPQTTKPQVAPGSSGPNAQELAMFIKAHLTRMTESVEAQLEDYADEVDFHDKPHATLRMIENDRKSWAQKYPVRFIFKDEIQPQFSAVRDPSYGWMATATFNWRWEFKARSGALMRGMTRDTWRIVPMNGGYRIISEHSADPVTGQPKD